MWQAATPNAKVAQGSAGITIGTYGTPRDDDYEDADDTAVVANYYIAQNTQGDLAVFASDSSHGVEQTMLEEGGSTGWRINYDADDGVTPFGATFVQEGMQTYFTMDKDYILHHDPTLETDNVEKDPTLEADNVEKDPTLEEDNVEKDPTLEEDNVEKDPTLEEDDVEKDPTLEEDYVEKDPTLEADNVEKDPTVEEDNVEKDPTLEEDNVEKDPPLEEDNVDKDLYYQEYEIDPHDEDPDDEAQQDPDQQEDTIVSIPPPKQKQKQKQMWTKVTPKGTHGSAGLVMGAAPPDDTQIGLVQADYDKLATLLLTDPALTKFQGFTVTRDIGDSYRTRFGDICQFMTYHLKKKPDDVPITLSALREIGNKTVIHWLRPGETQVDAMVRLHIQLG